MDIKKLNQAVQRSDLSGQWMALDLEMANSFRNKAPVICMVGLERYDPTTKSIVGAIGSIANREEEEALVRWTLSSLAKFQSIQPKACLLTFAGADNDLLWLRNRVEHYGISLEHARPLSMPHLDLKRMFYQSTFRDNISLKRLEILFGIERKESVTSRQVSYMLTALIENKDSTKIIPSRIMGYLHQDVRSLLDIQAQWNEDILKDFRMDEIDYFNHVCSFTRLLRKASSSKRNKFTPEQTQRAYKAIRQIEESLEHAIQNGGFEHFELPELPELFESNGIYDRERVIKRHQFLQQLPVGNNKPYRLRKQFHKPKGALALVRQGEHVLFIKRSQHVRAPGLWGLPGGELDAGESSGEGAVRELQEEVGLTGTPLHVLGATTSHSGHFVLVWVEIEACGPWSLNPYEVADARWVSPRDLRTLEPLIGGAVEGLQKIIGSVWRHKPKQNGRRKKNFVPDKFSKTP